MSVYASESMESLSSFSHEGRSFSLLRGEVAAKNLVQLFHMQHDTLVVVDKTTRTFIPDPDHNGKFTLSYDANLKSMDLLRQPRQLDQ